MRLKAAATALLALAINVIAAPAPVETSDTSLDVHLSQVGNTRVKADLTNTGKGELEFVHLNFFRHDTPVKKVSVFRDGHELKFKGIDTKFRLTNIDDSSITKLAPGEFVTDEFDIAATTDLSEGGRVTVKVAGLIHLVTDCSVSGSIPFESNTLTMDVDGAETAAVTKAFDLPLTCCTKLEPDTCNSTQIEIIQTALENAVELSNIAVDAAVNGPEKEFGKFFKSTDAETRASVSYRYRQVAQEAGSTAQGTSFFSCNDSEDFCHGSIVAYTWHSSDERVIPCDGFYEEPVFSKYCTQSTTSGILLHEFTHVEGLLDPRAEDHAYGFDASQKLPADKAFTNADNYAYYASLAHQKWKCED